MSIGKFVPVALMFGIFAFLYVYIGAVLGFILWISFFTWAMFFAAGPNYQLRVKRLPKNIIGALAGAVFAIVFIQFVPVLMGWGLSLPLTLGLLAGAAAFFILLLELTNWFEYAVAYFIGFAGYFAYAFGGGNAPGLKWGAYDPNSIVGNFVSFAVLMLVGYALGYITATLKRLILNAEGVPEVEHEQIFDVERRQQQ